MKNPKNMTTEELQRLAASVDELLAGLRDEADEEETKPHPRARFPRVDGRREWLEAEKTRCGNERCRKGCREGKKGHGPYWRLYHVADTGSGMTSKHLGAELPSDIAAAYDLPTGLDADSAHRYTREAREEAARHEAAKKTASA